MKNFTIIVMFIIGVFIGSSASYMVNERRQSDVVIDSIVPDTVYIERETVLERVGINVCVTATVYNPEAHQCDNTPMITADGSQIDSTNVNNLRWIAVSQDLLKINGGVFGYGDTVYVHHSFPWIKGQWIIHDTMNKRYKNYIDFLQDRNGFYGKWENVIIWKIKRNTTTRELDSHPLDG